MNPLPDRLNLDHLKKQAKQLIRLYRSRDAAAMARFRSTLPATAGLSDEDLSSRRTAPARCAIMHRARTRFCVLARLEALRRGAGGRAEGARRSRPALGAAGLFRRRQRHGQPREPARRRCGFWPMIPTSSRAILILPARSATKRALRQAMQADPAWVNLSGGPLRLPPLFAVAHSSLLRVEEFRERLHRCAALLIAAGADVNQHIHSRWQPGSLERARSALSALDALRRGRKQP